MLLVVTNVPMQLVANAVPRARVLDDDWVQLEPTLLPIAMEDATSHNVLLRGDPWLLAGAEKPRIDWYLGRLAKACGLFIGTEVFGPTDVRVEHPGAEVPEKIQSLVLEEMGRKVYPINPTKYVGPRDARLIFLTADCKRSTPFGSPMWADKFNGLPYHTWGFATIECPAAALAGADKIVAVSTRAYEWARLYVPAVDLQLDSELEKFQCPRASSTK